MTPIRTAIVTDATTTRRHLALTMLLGVSIGASGVIGAMQYVPVAIADSTRILQAACKLPQQDGELTQWMMVGGKLQCWRYR